jgi:N-acetyl-anhydromuramyl-L-alanine amidase AmpD
LVSILLLHTGQLANAQTELISNGGFESGNNGAWHWTASNGICPISNAGNLAHSGSWYDWQGGDLNLIDSVYQDVTIPANASSATLSFYYNINSQEGNTVAYDTFTVTIRNTSGTILATVGNWSNMNQDAGPGNPYYHRVTYNLLPYAGQTIRIHFSSSNNSTRVTNFRVDDVSVLVATPNVSVPTVTTQPATLVTTTSARIWGRITSDGGAPILERRLEWGLLGTWSNFTSSVTVSGNDFYYDLTGLSPNTTYQFRAWARNSAGWGSSGAAYFTTSTSCSYSLSSNSASVSSSSGSSSFSVYAGAGCSWSAVSDAPSWLHTSSSGSGNGTVNYTYDANTGAGSRTGHIIVGGQTFTVNQSGTSTVGYPGAVWMGPAATGNYESGRSGNTITYIIIHTTEDTMPGALTRFQTPGEQASSHYIIGTNGTIWQVVSDSDTAYHAGNLTYNRRSIGIELEGYADGRPTGDFTWQSNTQFTALKNLINWLATQYSIPKDRTHIFGHNQVPSPGGTCPPTSQWGGCHNHYDPGAWFNWCRLMNDLGRAPSFKVVTVTSATSILTLPQSDAPVIVPAAVGQKFVAYDSQAGYYLVFLSGKELPQNGLPTSSEFHWDGWIPAANVTIDNGATQLEVSSGFPIWWNIRSTPSLSGSVLGHTIQGKRYVATGNTAVADGFTWREFYIATTSSTVATGWTVSDAFTVIGDTDTTAPTINSFTVTPGSINPGGSFSISYTVSDSGGSGLKQVELWRANIDGSTSDSSWTKLQTTSLSGNGPVSGSFVDSPTTVGSYWYGLHVVDGAGNLTDERAAGRGPLKVDVVLADSDDQINEAFYLGVPKPTVPLVIDGDINNDLDVDMFSFEVTAGQRIAFDVDQKNGSNLDSYLRLFNASGIELIYSDDDPAPGESPSSESYFEYTFTSSGRYYVAVSGFPNYTYDPITGNGDTSGSTGKYSLILTDITPDTTPPIVTINQAAGQEDPTSSSPINFTVIFSEPVTGFDSSDVILGGTAGATTKIVTGSGTTYNVAVSGMTQSGTVIVTIPAGAAQDAAGNLSLASSSTDNSVYYIYPNTAPNRPSNLLPTNGAQNQPLTPLLKASAFSDPDAGDTHAASQWLVRRAEDNVVVFDSGDDAANKTSCLVPAGTLVYATTYNWQVRYKDNHGTWSDYSLPTTFTTMAPSVTANIIGGKIVLTWPTNAVGFRLVCTTNLTPNPSWTEVSPQPVVVSGQNVVSNKLSGVRMFYRLKKP